MWEIKIQETSSLGVPHTGRRVVKKQGLTGRSIARIEKQIRLRCMYICGKSSDLLRHYANWRLAHARARAGQTSLKKRFFLCIREIEGRRIRHKTSVTQTNNDRDAKNARE